MNAQTLSVIFASEAFKANPTLFLEAIALTVPTTALPEALAEAPVALPEALPEAPAALPEAPAALPETPKEKRPPTAWNILVGQTVSEMRENGWAAFTDMEGLLWPASRPEGGKHVYSDGRYVGKEASRAAGGFKLASLRNSQSKPEAAAAALARIAHREEAKVARRSAGAEVPKKERKPMSEETKAAAALKRAATKAAKTSVDLALDVWSHAGTEYLKNARNDVLSRDGEWLGHWDGSAIIEAPEPSDFENLSTRE